MTYKVRDDYGCSSKIEADSALDACRDWVSGGDWGNVKKTVWVSCRATPILDNGEENEAEAEDHTITVDPDEPDCVEGETHEWVSPVEVVGGLEENPGVFGHGGGVIIVCVCAKCGRYQRTDTWATNPENGEQGLESVEYRSADSTSLDWLSRSDS